MWSFRAPLETECGNAGADVWDHGTALISFFRGLADALGGFDGERTYDSLEGQLSIRSVHDGRGTVECTVSVAGLAPPSWSFCAQMDLGSGAHLERIAEDIEQFVNGIE